MFERVAERVSSLSKLKSVLVTDSHVQLFTETLLGDLCGHEQRRRRLPAAPEGREAARGAARGGHARGGGGGSREQD